MTMKKWILILAGSIAFTNGIAQGTIDREQLVRRHTVRITKSDALESLTVGNGQFAFTADVTGLQKFSGLLSKRRSIRYSV